MNDKDTPKDTPEATNKLFGFERSQIPLIALMLTLFMIIVAMFGWLRLDNSALRSDMNAMRAELKADMNAMRTELKSEMSEIRARLDRIESDISDLKTDVALGGVDIRNLPV